MTNFEYEMDNVYEAEEFWDSLAAQYDPDSPAFEQIMQQTKLIAAGYNFSAESYKILKRSRVEDKINRFKFFMTINTFFISITSFLINPNIGTAGLLGTAYLTLKLKHDIKNSTEYLTVKQKEELLTEIDNFEAKYLDITQKIDERIDFLTNEDEISKITDPNEYKYRKACKIIADLINNDRFTYPNDKDIEEELIRILKERYNTNEDEISLLLALPYAEYTELCMDINKSSEHARKLAKIPKRKW